MTELSVLQVISSVEVSDGGPATFAAELNAALTDIGVDAKLLAPGDRTQANTTDRATLFKRSRPRSLQNSWSLLGFLVCNTAKVDVIHVDGLYRAHNFGVWLGCKLSRTPYVAMPHGTLEPYQRQFRRRFKAMYDFLLGRRFLRDARFVICASKSEAENLVNSGLVNSQRAVIVSLAAREYVAAPVGELVDCQYMGRGRTVLFLGRLAYKKQPVELVRAWYQSGLDARAQLIVAGPDGEVTAQELRDEASRLGLLHVNVVGRAVSPEEAAWLYRRAGLFVLPSLNENFGMTIAEAMIAGCAVLSTKQAAASEHVVRAGCGQVYDANEPSRLAVLLRSLVEEGDLLQLGERGRGYAHVNLTWGHVASEFASVYARAVVAKT